jgi:hypothetical protein
MRELLDKLVSDYTDVRFVAGDICSWSPKDRTVTYRIDRSQPDASAWALLHEAGHADLGHTTYGTDFELVQLEVAAWQRAEALAGRYGLTIDPEHIQDCLDTYREWLHRRSTCPQCGTVSLQADARTYTCFNCRCSWKVSTSRFCRPYRQVRERGHKKSAPQQVGSSFRARRDGR